MYLTGGIGAARTNEGFTRDFDLPDETAYAETCATIGLMLWNHRLLQFSGDGKYADLMERAFFNGILSGLALDGANFFYENPLASSGHHHREPWFTCPCCPPNLARTLASLGGYFYSTGADDLWVHHYAQGTVNTQVAGRDLSLRQVTNYPWDGDVTLEVGVPSPQRFTLHLRLPGWCEKWHLAVNGEQVLGDDLATSKGYIHLSREWNPGDVVTYKMEMPIRAIWAHPAVRDLQGRVALERGPLVYCLEGVDHPGLPLDQIAIDPHQVSSEFQVAQDDQLLGGVNVLRGQGTVMDQSGWEDALYSNKQPSSKKIDITAIPYYAWDNRAPGQMRVWLQARGG
jgi:DUF1680 family protein